MQGHHALLARYSGSAEHHIDPLLRHQLQVERKGNPDVHVLVREVFTIEDSRALYERASIAPFRSENVLVCVCDEVTEEAQQALLKLFEEPQQRTRFVVLVHRRARLLPTLLSRFQTVALPEDNTPEGVEGAAVASAEFLAHTPALRMRTIAALVEDAPQSAIDEFLAGVEQLLYSRGVPPALLREILFVRARINLRGAPKKQLLEHLACTLPQFG